MAVNGRTWCKAGALASGLGLEHQVGDAHNRQELAVVVRHANLVADDGSSSVDDFGAPPDSAAARGFQVGGVEVDADDVRPGAHERVLRGQGFGKRHVCASVEKAGGLLIAFNGHASGQEVVAQGVDRHVHSGHEGVVVKLLVVGEDCRVFFFAQSLCKWCDLLHVPPCGVTVADASRPALPKLCR